MSGTQTVQYMHIMNWVYQLPGTFIGDYDSSIIKGVKEWAMKGPKELFTFTDILMVYGYFAKTGILYQKFENFDFTHKSNDE